MNTYLVKNLASLTLGGETGPLTDTRIAQVVDQFLKLYPDVVTERTAVINYLRANFSVTQDAYQILDTDKAHRVEPWIKEKRASGELEWRFWERYRLYLQAKMSAPTINQLYNLTDDILDRLMDPKTPGPWERRGMVVGQVQSGKTGNYVGLMNKAADAGYKLIIVLAGVHDSLRNQTQVRIDEGFLGFNTQLTMSFAKANNRIGVGTFNQNLAANALTTRMGDFKRQAAKTAGHQINGTDPIVLVVKKNTGILKNLIQWLAQRGETQPDGKKLIERVPLLLIDDEADNASINTSKDYISTINGLIRSLLSLFEQSAYVGYTATPFANMFIRMLDEDIAKGLNIKLQDFELKVGQDLFPRDFIINIPAPSNYIGPAKVFGLPATAVSEQGAEPLPIVINLDQADGTAGDYATLVPNKHKKNDPRPNRLPPTLLHAIKHFVLVCAARHARGQMAQHNSMLVHISRFVPWIDKVASLVDGTLKEYQRQIEFNTGELRQELKQIWNDEFVPITRSIRENIDNDPNAYKDAGIQPLTWEQIESSLFPAILKIEVRAVHSQTRTTGLEHHNIAPLDYALAEDETPPRYLSVIAVGGDKLSRGLTLEGLSISYYLRASKMYDTLMQMGRWFGYRPGYVDLCRLFTSSELIRWYEFITLASEEVREDFDRMFMLNRTPREFGLKVRMHKGALLVTAINKFKDVKTMDLSYSAELEQSHRMTIDERLFRSNLEAVERLIPQLGSTVTPPNQRSAKGNNYVWRTNNYTICQFLREYRIDPRVMDMPKLVDYIGQQLNNGDLTNWTVAVINNGDAKPDARWQILVDGLPASVGLTSRSNPKGSATEYVINKAQLISPVDEFIDLNNEQHDKALEETKQDWTKKERKTDPDKPSTFRIKYNRPSSQGLLLIYPLNPVVEEGKDPKTYRTISPVPIMGLAISFPNIEGDQKVTYYVNQQFVQEYDYNEDEPEMSNEPI